jgi:hypothetical protein
MSYEEMVKAEKYVQLQNWDEMSRRLESVDDPRHFLREHFFPKMLELVDRWVNAGFVAGMLKCITDRLCAGVGTNETRDRARKLAPRLIDAVIDDWDVAYRVKLVFLESSRHAPGW